MVTEKRITEVQQHDVVNTPRPENHRRPGELMLRRFVSKTEVETCLLRPDLLSSEYSVFRSQIYKQEVDITGLSI